MAPDITENVLITNSKVNDSNEVKQRNGITNNQNLCQNSIDNNNTNCNNNNNNYINNIVNDINKNSSESSRSTTTNFKPQIRWPDLLVQISIHLGAIYGFILLFSVKYLTILWFIALIIGSGFGITAGAHRLWSHKSYKAKWQLRAILVFLFTISGQRDAYTWAHDHRVHHKYSESDADPHDARRGFFFSHVGWLFLTPHPEVVAKRKIIDMSDLEADPIVMWQRKYYIPLFALLVILFPIYVPYYFWNESLWMAFWTAFVCRFCIVLNIAYSVNSFAHMYGARPYDKKISPTESLPVAIAALGEGWHNYHHVFPWDYKTSELGDYKLNISTWFIDTFAKIGWAYERKSVSPEMVARRAAKCGDGSHIYSPENIHKNALWGYGDKDISKEDEADLKNMCN